MLKKQFYSILLFSAIFFSTTLNAQTPARDNTSSILPVSPEAASLGKSIDAPVSNYTGIPDISIPFHQIKKGDIEMNISISYQGGGIRVDEISSRIGLGWTLNAGGMITRVTRGTVDVPGFQTKIEKFLNSQMTENEKDQYFFDVYEGRADSEPDLYYVSLNNLSLKMFKGNNGEWITMPRNQNVRVQENIEGYDWIITDGKGIRYKLKDKEFTESSTNSQTVPGSAAVDGGYTSGISSWLLTEIEDSKGNRINFIYEAFHNSFVTKGSETVSIPTSINYMCSPKTTTFLYSLNTILGLKLKSILYADGEVKFLSNSAQRLDLPGDYNTNKVEVYNNKKSLIKGYQLFTSYFINNETGKNTPNIFSPADGYRLRLDSIKESMAGKYLKPYRFKYGEDYSTPLPYRNSHAQDHWGYFNGVNNTYTSVSYMEGNLRKGAIKKPNASFAKGGILTSITYPTGGTVDFEYEGNTYTGMSIPEDRENVNLATLSGHNTPRPNIPASEQLYFEYVQSFEMSENDFGPDGDPAIIEPNSTVEGLSPSCSCSVNYTLTFPDGSVIGIPSQANNGITVMQRGTYKIRAEINMEFAGNPFVYFYLTLDAQKISKAIAGTIAGPGLRIKQITRTASPGNVLKTYYNYDDPSTGLSSGKIANIPDYRRDLTVHYGAQWTTDYSCDNVLFSSSSNYPLLNTKGSSIGYTHVTIFEDLNGEGGKKTYKYTYENDINAESPFPYPPTSPQDWKRGLLTEEAAYKRIGNTYELLKKQSFAYGYLPGAYYRTRGIKLGAHAVYNRGVTAKDFTSGLSVAPYNLETDAYVLTSDTLLVLDGGTGLRTVNNYSYSGVNYQVSSIGSINSKNQQQKRKIYYVADYLQNVGSSNLLSSMVNRHMINVPIEEVSSVIVGGVEKLVSATAYEYNNKQLPGSEQIYVKAIYEADISNQDILNRYNLINLPAHYFAKISNELVNDYGQPLHIKTNGKMDVCYLWSYNNQYPVAEIKNVDYATLAGILGLGQITYFGNLNPDKAAIDAFLAPLKTALPFAHISSYVYEPIQGITSMTDAKGMTSTFMYDDFQRLKHIKNQNGDIVKSYEYHFKP